MMRIPLGAFIVTLVMANTTNAITGSKPDIKKLTQGATLIVCGRVTAIRSIGKATVVEGIPATLMEAKIAVGSTLKGHANGTVVAFRFAQPTVPIGIPGLSIGQYLMFFLVSADSTLMIEDSFSPGLPCTATTAYSGGEPYQKVAAALWNVASSSLATEPDRVLAIDLLADIQITPFEDGLRQLSSENVEPQALRASAAAALLRANDVPTLSVIQSMIRQKLSERLLSKIGDAISTGVRDPKAIVILTELLRASPLQIRLGSAAALRKMDSVAAIPALLEALRDSDELVRYQGALGLGLVTAQYDWTPPMDEYLNNEPRYLDHWRAWAKAQGHE